jgi:hypothetical protein
MPEKETTMLLKKLLVLACLTLFVGAISGCHAEAKTNKGHGVEGSVG